MSKKVLVISPTFPYPMTTGNRARIYQFLLNLKELRYEVHFLYINTELFDQSQAKENSWTDKVYVASYRPPHRTFVKRAIRRLKRFFNQDLAFTYLIDSWYDNSLNTIVRQISKQIQFDVVIVEYVFFSKVLECFDNNVLKIIDTHDVYTNRHRIYLNNNQYPHWYSTTATEEAKGLNRADIIIAIQQKEKDFFSQLVKKQVVVIGHTVVLQKAVQPLSLSKTILFVGSGTPMNVQGIHFFLQEVFPKIKLQHPNAQFILAGKVCEFVQAAEDCMQLGEVTDLQKLYEMAAVVINPIPYGTGLKIKTIEALGYAKPLVTTSVGAEGLEEGIDRAFVVADTAKAFAQAIITILDNPEVAARLSRQAYDFAQQWNENNLRQLSRILELPQQATGNRAQN